MARITRFVVSRVIRLHEYLTQNYVKILILSIAISLLAASTHWLTLNHPKFFANLNENLQEFPFGVTFGILTVILIAVLLLYALHLESTQKSHVRSRATIRQRYIDYIVLCLCTQMNEATDRYLRRGPFEQDQLDAMHAEFEDCFERFRERARKLLHVPSAATLQEYEDHFRLEQLPGTNIGEEILKMKRNSKPLLSERAIKELLTK